MGASLLAVAKSIYYSSNANVTWGDTWDVIDVANAPTDIVDQVFWTDTGVTVHVLAEMPFITAVQSVHINFHVNSSLEIDPYGNSVQLT